MHGVFRLWVQQVKRTAIKKRKESTQQRAVSVCVCGGGCSYGECLDCAGSVMLPSAHKLTRHFKTSA